MDSTRPLADLLRPKDLENFVGQQHLVGKGKPLFEAIKQKQIFSLVFWGPPGVGKTTLAKILARAVDATLYELSAVSAKKDDIRQIIERHQGSFEKVVLFLDEIHRFSKAQQDYLLPFVESGAITLIGATTENPSFEVIAPLLSRMRIFILEPLQVNEMEQLLDTAVKTLRSSYPKLSIEQDAKDWLLAVADGDARAMLTMLDNTLSLYQSLTIENLKDTLQNKHLRYDKLGEEHYNTISAFIKSMRASDADAALYYLARMIESGEDPLFIARRMIIFASEDIGLAQPTALVVANAVFDAVSKIGYPEARLSLAHGTLYLATAKKDRRVYDALGLAQDDVKKHGNLPIPMSLRNAPTKLMKSVGYGKGYELYSSASHLPEKLKGKKYLQAR